MKKADIGLIGLGVMGRMLALNIERHGYCVAGYDVDEGKVSAFEADRQEKALIGCRTLGDFIAALDKPRRIMLMVPAGAPVDAVIEEIKFVLEPGRSSNRWRQLLFQDTERRARDLEPAVGCLYMGTGVSGGEYGALWGPSIMPGGQPEGLDDGEAHLRSDCR
jgi:6-phosphogluconate dehydrogenase